jgi:hypothetical protein
MKKFTRNDIKVKALFKRKGIEGVSVSQDYGMVLVHLNDLYTESEINNLLAENGIECEITFYHAKEEGEEVQDFTIEEEVVTEDNNPDRLTIMDYVKAKKNGISQRAAYQRFMEYGWDKERAITEPVAKRDLYKKWKPLIDLVKLKRHTFYTRVISMGMTPFEACITPVEGVKGRPVGNGKLTEKHIAIAKRNGISRGTVNQRVYSYKWSVERAITEPVHTQFRKKA